MIVFNSTVLPQPLSPMIDQRLPSGNLQVDVSQHRLMAEGRPTPASPAQAVRSCRVVGCLSHQWRCFYVECLFRLRMHLCGVRTPPRQRGLSVARLTRRVGIFGPRPSQYTFAVLATACRTNRSRRCSEKDPTPESRQTNGRRPPWPPGPPLRRQAGNESRDDNLSARSRRRRTSS